MRLVKKVISTRALCDVLGDEDHLGDMDLKLRTSDGINALQMDIKVDGIARNYVQSTRSNSDELHILSG